MKPTRKYTCTRRMNKNGDRIWVVLENGRKFYRIFKTQAQGIEYFQPLKTHAEMMVQQAQGNLFIKTVYTKMEMERKGIKSSFKTITTRKVVKDSDKIFEEESLEPPKTPIVKSTKPKKTPIVKSTKPKKTEETPKKTIKKITKKPEVIIKEVKVIEFVDKIININSNTGEIMTDLEVREMKHALAYQREEERLRKLNEEERLRKINEREEQERLRKLHKHEEEERLRKLREQELLEKKDDLILELEKLDEEERVIEFEKKDTVNISIIDEILSRKTLVENSWNESITQPEVKVEQIEDTIYVKEEVEKPIIINSKKIEFDDEPLEKTSTIENIIEQRTKEIDVESVDYGRIKEHTNYENTQIKNFQSEKNIEKNIDINREVVIKKEKNTKFWVLTVLISLLIMGITALIVLYMLNL